MSKLDELIAELCPDGVEYKQLGDERYFSFHYGKGNKIPEDNGGKYDVYGANGIVSHIDEYNCEDVSIIGHIGAVGQVQRCKGKCFVTYNGTIAEPINRDLVDSQYMYYILTMLDLPSYKKGSQPFLSVSDFSKIKVPIPPLPVQEEIVRILDNFTDLTAELQAELQARAKQYEYYHNRLTDFSNRKDIEWCSVGDYFTFKNGINKDKGCFGSGDYIVNFTDVYNHRWITRDVLKGRVETEEKDLKAYDAKYGDVFFTRTSETKEDIGMVSALVDDIDRCVFSGFVLRARPNTDNWLPKFCSYYFSSHKIRMEIVRYASFTTRALTSGPRLSKLMIPLISKEEQQKIVDILDNFVELCNGFEDGIPAEIEARQKQYEYYRNKLLTFKELGV